MKLNPLSRRTLLRGAGAALGLPWLEAMKAGAAESQGNEGSVSPRRMAMLYMPNGVREDLWTPEGTGREFQLSATLQPLSEFRDELLVLTNLWNQGSKGGEGHYVKISGFLTCTTITKTQGVDLSCNGVSMDQVAAHALGNRTPLPSLELAIEPVSTGVDKNVGYTRVYGSHLAWTGPNTPLAREINPRLVFERLMRASGPQGNSASNDAQLLDRVLDDAGRLRGRLGQADQHRLDEYLSGVRSLEQRLERASKPGENPWKARKAIDPSDCPIGIPKEHADHVRLMLDMIALAFETDTTRISTFLLGNEVTNKNFSFLEGVSGGHHSTSHHENDADKLRQYQLINRWYVEQYRYLLRKLAAMKEGDSNVLANSMILLGAGIRDGNKHDPHNLPIVVAGSAGGRLATGQHLAFGPDSPLANLYVSMLEAFGTPVERFADSTGKLAGALA